MLSDELKQRLHDALRRIAHLEALAVLFHAIAQGGEKGLFGRARDDLNEYFTDDTLRDKEIARLVGLLSTAYQDGKSCPVIDLPENPLLIAEALGKQLGESFLSSVSQPVKILGRSYHAFKTRPSRLHEEWTSPRRWFKPIWLVETPTSEKDVNISRMDWHDGANPVCALIEFDDKVGLDTEIEGDTFIVCGLVEEDARWGNLESALEEACKENAQVVVLPELSMTRGLLGRLADWLNGNGNTHTFRLIAAGSYHHRDSPDDELARNRMVVLDRRGVPLFHHDKWYEFDRPKRERITPGSTLQLLFAPPGLLSFAICKDFCHIDGFDWKALALDGLCVASMGDKTTLTAHRAAARIMKLTGARVLLVNNTKESDGAHRGFFSLPGAEPQANEGNVTLRAWNGKTVPPPKKPRLRVVK